MLKSVLYSSALLFICYFILYKGAISAFKRPTSSLDFDFTTNQIKYGNANDYKLLHKISAGKHSHVFFGTHIPTKDKVTLKIFFNATEFQVLKEFSVALKLYDAPNVLPPRDFLKEVGKGNSIKHVLVFNYFDYKPYMSLFTSLTKIQIKHFIYQTLRTLQYAHNQGVIHNDIRPQNILMNENSLEVKVIDWGQSEYYFANKERSTKVGTLYFKAPELLLGYKQYDYAVDIWSTGCLLAEMVFQKLPFFQKSPPDLIDPELTKEQRRILDYMNQLEAIARIRGSEGLREYVTGKNRTYEDKLLKGIGNYEKKRFEEFVNEENKGLIDDSVFDLLEKMLTVDFSKRITASEALEHPYFEDVRRERIVKMGVFKDKSL